MDDARFPWEAQLSSFFSSSGFHVSFFSEKSAPYYQGTCNTPFVMRLKNSSRPPQILSDHIMAREP